MTDNKSLDKQALEFHNKNTPGKISILPTKPLVTQRDLSLAYSPGVAAPCLEIANDPNKAYDYTAKANFVAVISNGSAVLGLGNLGALASKPVMEGKSVLFKRFADIDSIDLEIDTQDPEEFINSVKYLSPSWGGINLEDIKAPECFIIEERLKKLMDIPIFHDDQHGTAIITAAGLINAAYIAKKDLADLKIVINGAGAAGIACAELIKDMGGTANNVVICDTRGVIYKGREAGMNKWKELHAVETNDRSLEDALTNADVFIGLSVKGAVTQDMVKKMADTPIIFAMANPDPEITPEDAKAVRPDAIIATGRSDYNNQVNNVMGFPYIFRGALDVRATQINQEMKIAAAEALARLARKSVPDEVRKAYAGKKMIFGPDYIIPVPFDPRLMTTIPVAVAKAAMETGVARKNIDNLNQYKQELGARLDPTSNAMSLILDRAQANPQRVIFAEGEDDEVIKAAIMMRDNQYGLPVLIGRSEKIKSALGNLGPDYSLEGIEVLNAAVTNKLDEYIDYFYQKMQRKGYLYRDCARLVKNDRNIFSACVLALGDADAMITGFTKGYYASFKDVSLVLDAEENKRVFSYSILIKKDHNLIISDSTIHELPTAEELADITCQTAEIARDLGYNPRAALLSFSNFGNPMHQKATRIRDAVKVLDHRQVDFEYDGEMSASTALNVELQKIYPFCRLTGPANILIMPALHTAHISTKLLQEVADGAVIGPILTGFEKPVQIMPLGYTASDIVNMAAFAAVDAIKLKQKKK